VKDYKVFVTNRASLAGALKLPELFTAFVREKTTPAEEWQSWLAEADAIYSLGGMKIDAALLALAPKVKVISQVSAGYDNIDAAACSARGIKIGHTPGVGSDATADMAFGLILCSARYLHKAWLHVKSGEWGQKKRFVLGVDLKGKLLGIVGLGSVGLATAKRAKASGMKIAYHSRRPAAGAAEVSARYMSLDELLASADFVLLTLPLTKETRGLFGDAQFAKMKPSARFINAGRGALVDTDALCRALRDKKIAYAAMDVTDPEPLPGDHPLLSFDNVAVFPHIGGSTRETRDAMSLLALDNIIAGLEGRKMPFCVNRETEGTFSQSL
jgi:glyoxylate reductase